MAKRKRKKIPYSQMNIKRALEEQLDDYSHLVRKNEGKPVSFEYFNTLRSGVFKTALKLGFECRCASESADPAIPSCWCTPKAAGIRGGHQAISLKSRDEPYTFDGLKCRDRRGKAVALGKCR